jgi:hypothetical protein
VKDGKYGVMKLTPTLTCLYNVVVNGRGAVPRSAVALLLGSKKFDSTP